MLPSRVLSVKVILAQMESQYSSDQYRVIQSENNLAFVQLKTTFGLEPEEDFSDVSELDEKSVLVTIPRLEDVYPGIVVYRR